MLKSVEIDLDESYCSLIKNGRWSALAERMGSSPLLWVLVALGPVIAGTLGSLWPTEIKNSFRLSFSLVGINWAATSFWVAIFVTGLSFGLGQWAQSRASGALRVMVRRLQTLPPQWLSLCISRLISSGIQPSYSYITIPQHYTARNRTSNKGRSWRNR